MKCVTSMTCHIQNKIITKADHDSGDKIEQPFQYPVALKPANSVEWLDVHFEGRKKKP